MAAFLTMAAAGLRCRAQVAARVWVVAHPARNFNGTIIARFQRFMSPSAPGNGGWTETGDDSVN